MILKNLFRRKFRTLMFVVGISVVLTGMQVLLGITNGLDNQMDQQFSRDQIDVLALEQNSAMVFNSNIQEETATALRQEAGIAGLQQSVYGLLSTPKFPMLVVVGKTPDQFGHSTVVDGRQVNDENEVMIGKNIRKDFGAAVGDTIELGKKPYKVTGFVESGLEVEDGALIMTTQGAQRLLNKGGMFSILGIQLAKGANLEEVLPRLATKYDMLTFTRAKDYVKTQKNIEMIKGIGAGVGALSVIGGAVIVFIFSLIIVQERTREIGLLRAIGWRRSRIIRLVLGETLALSFLGAVLSLGFSALIIFIIQNTSSISAILPAEFTWAAVGITFAIALLLGFTGGLASAWKASNLNPLEAFGRE